MEELVFDPNKLIDFSASMKTLYRDLAELNDQFEMLWRRLNVTIKSMGTISDSYRNISREMEDQTDNLLILSRVLAEVAEIYRLAERETLRLSMELPTSVAVVALTAVFTKNESNYSRIELVPGIIRNKDIILEDWLSELVYNKDYMKSGETV